MTARCTLLVAAALSLGLLASTSSPALAGDPCPIGVAVVDLGVPDWASPELKQRVKGGDPLLARMVKLASGLECTEVVAEPSQSGRLAVTLYEEVDPTEMAVDRLKAKLVDDKRRFLCDKAQKQVGYLSKVNDYSGVLLFYRGHSRILLVSPGWKSVCVPATKADKMSDKELVALWNKVNGPLIKDRHDNP
jgi:hypothetical protein